MKLCYAQVILKPKDIEGFAVIKATERQGAMLLNISIPDSIVLSTRQSTKQFELEAKNAIAIKFYADEKLSLGQAAELAGLSKFDFIKLLAQNNIAVFRFDGDEKAELQSDVDVAMRYVNA